MQTCTAIHQNIAYTSKTDYHLCCSYHYVLQKTLHISHHTATTITLLSFCFVVALSSPFCSLIVIIVSIFFLETLYSEVAQAYKSRNKPCFANCRPTQPLNLLVLLKFMPTKSKNDFLFSKCMPAISKTTLFFRIVALRKSKYIVVLQIVALQKLKSIVFLTLQAYDGQVNSCFDRRRGTQGHNKLVFIGVYLCLFIAACWQSAYQSCFGFLPQKRTATVTYNPPVIPTRNEESPIQIA